jgi:hypothetical protein
MQKLVVRALHERRKKSSVLSAIRKREKLPPLPRLVAELFFLCRRKLLVEARCKHADRSVLPGQKAIQHGAAGPLAAGDALSRRLPSFNNDLVYGNA